MKSVLKLGTRRSLLAWAQSSWVARELERLHPGLKVEMVGIDTRGDKILDIPLSKVEGKEFFVAELDDALRSARTDVNVHSMKDLSLDRPEGFILGAIPMRAPSNDLMIFGPGVMDKLAKGQTLKIGTSSPRRLENLPPFLTKALPRVNGGPTPKLEFVEIRGNVNTRLGRVHEPDGSERHLDGVVLALAGLTRLWIDGPGRIELEKLFQGTRIMVLPLKENPAAPAQGALAIECRTNDAETRKILSAMHCKNTEEDVAAERAILRAWGGGCHQRFGAAARRVEGLGRLLHIRGRKPLEEFNGEFVEELRWQAPAKPAGTIRAWDGSAHHAQVTPILGVAAGVEKAPAVFVAHSRAAEGVKFGAETRVWSTGTQSWYKLAEKGIWVEGCAEGLGFEVTRKLLTEGVLRLPALKDWTVLTHQDAEDTWSEGKVIGTYRVEKEYTGPAMGALSEATHVYWSSGSQWEALGSRVASSQVIHACGSGKTAEKLKKHGLKPMLFPSAEEWRKWLGIQK